MTAVRGVWRGGAQDRYKCGKPGREEALAAGQAKGGETYRPHFHVRCDSAQYALMADGEIVLSGDTNDYEIDRIENNRRLFVTNVDSIADSTRMMAALIITERCFLWC